MKSLRFHIRKKSVLLCWSFLLVVICQCMKELRQRCPCHIYLFSVFTPIASKPLKTLIGMSTFVAYRKTVALAVALPFSFNNSTAIFCEISKGHLWLQLLRLVRVLIIRFKWIPVSKALPGEE